MTPRMMEDLLFDDILHGDAAREEHRRFRRVLRLLGVEVIEAVDLLAGAVAREEGRRWVEARVFPHLTADFRDRLSAMTPPEMARSLVTGVRRDAPEPQASLDDLFGVRPLPNWCFQRDTQVVMGSGVLFAAMRNWARHREALLSRAIFRYHPEYADTPVLADIATDPDREPERGRGDEDERYPSLEGGDVLVLSAEIVVVGRSERTTNAGVAALVRALARTDGAPRWLLRVELPRERAFMHVDTLFTPVGHDAALLHAPVVLPGRPLTAAVWEYDLHSAEPRPVEADDLLAALARRGLSYEPIPCGGPDPVDQQREQWTDGANALALAPDVVVLYDRNVRTADEMDRRGYRVVSADDLLLGSTDVSLDRGEKVCVLTPSNELSRARGGPHCLTHPLVRA